MEPSPENRVAIKSSTNDDHVPKAHVTLSYSNNDKFRIDAAQDMMHNIAKALGGRFDKDPDTIEKGRSHHEAGTLRMGHADDERSVTNADGQVHGSDNLYVADAALFPCVGVANPMLTVTALGYRLADHIAARLSGASMPQRLRSQAARAVGSQKQAARERFERHSARLILATQQGWQRTN